MQQLPPLNALRAFDAAGRLASITKAANELCVTPAAISRQINSLEEYLGVRLFYREHRGIVLTPKGFQYHVEVAHTFSSLRAATRDLCGEKTNRRVFNIWAPHSIAMRWLLPRLASLHNRHPDLEVRLHTSVLKLSDFEHADIDAGIILGRGEANGMIFHKIMANEIAPVCTPEKASRLREPSALAGETLLHTHARPDDWHVWLKSAGISNVDASCGMQYESSALAYEAALAGYGIVIGQKALITKELEDGRLIAPFDLWIDLGDYTYYFVMPPDTSRRKSEAAVTFRRWIESLPGSVP